MSSSVAVRTPQGGRPQLQAEPRRELDALVFLDSPGAASTAAQYGRGEVIFSEGDPCDSVLYISQGDVRLSVVARSGKEAIIAVLGASAFLGEEALQGRATRRETATAVSASTVIVVPKAQMIRLLHAHHAISNHFIAHMLARNIRLTEDLVDQLMNSSEKRLARTLLLLAGYGKPHGQSGIVPAISQGLLAEMVGTTRSRVNIFMNNFKKRGFIEYDGGGIRIRPTLLSVVLDE